MPNLSFYKPKRTRKTKLRSGDMIGYDAGRSSQALKFFRSLRGDDERLLIREEGSSFLLQNFRWPLDKEEFEALASLMAAGMGYCITAVNCRYLPVTWAYRLYKA